MALSTLEQHLLTQLDRLALAIVDAEMAWTTPMREAYEEAVKGQPHIPLTLTYVCPYCTKVFPDDAKHGTSISCCGEVGHAQAFYEVA